ncbi:hypothetical protein F3C99_02915 [Vitellibacter sp. q18]|jgi:hypothetical protein|nr:hypothetical protein [Aequorivita lutea]
MNTITKPNTAFWIIAIFALLWNLIGVYFWVLEYFLMTDELKAAMSPEQLTLMERMPGWGMYVYGLAVITGLLGSILLLTRRKAATAIFGLSLLAILVMQGYWIFAMDVVGVMGPQALIMPLIVIAIAIFEYFYSKGAARNGWLS